VLRVNYLAGYAREVSRDTTHVLLASENVLGVYNIPSLGRLRGDLIAVAACSKWAQHDTSAALRNAREALGYGANLSGDLPLRLIDIFDELGLRKESIRLIGNMLIRTDDRVWMKKYRSAGGAFLIEPRMGEFFAALGMEKGVFAFPAFIFPFSVAKGEARKCFWFEKPDYRAQLRMLPMCGLSTTRQSFFMYEYRRNEAGTKLVWSPLDFRESGELVNLGPIMETDVAEVNPTNQQFIEYGYAQYPFDTNKEGRAVTMLALRQGGIGGQSSEGEVRTFFTAGIDLTGRGKHWIDSTLITPVRIGDRFYAHERYAHLMANITRGSQADSLGLREGDLVLRLGEHDINTTMTVNRIKTLYPDRYPLELVVLRGADTLRYTILNGRIGFDSYDCLALVEIDPDTGKHMASKRLPPGYGSHLNAPEAINSAGEIIYSRGDTVLFLDPVSGREKRVTINGIADHYRYWGVEAKDIVVLLDPVPVELLALDISKNADDDARVLWKQSFGDVYRLYNEPRYCIGDDSYHIPMILRDGTLLLIDAVNGTVVSRETLPFQDFGFLPQLRNGTLYGIAATKIFGWKVAYYHPPFPWKQAGYGAIAIVPVVFLLILVHRDRVKKLKERQAEELKRAEIDAEISAARKLQAGLIPTGSHRVGDFHIVGTFIPAWEVAGDYFDFQLLDDGRLVVVMGDVSGHGLPAGILVSMAKASIMTLNRKKTIDLQDTLQSLNEVVRNGSPGKDMFMTLCYLIIDPRKRTISCSANGHPFPLIARKDGTVSEIGANGGYPLGIRARQEFEITQVNFRPGDTVLLYTDGIPEKLNEKGEPWGYERFSETFREFAPNARLEEVVEGILGRAIVYTGAVEPEDDMALVAIRYSAESSAR
jgi:serine phosphatase RsbU (regulator of sigma subunit)